MTPKQSSQTMKPATAAKKLGVYLPATPAAFQEGTVTRGQLEELEKNPPEWLADLRRNGPHPRPVVAGRLGISISGLARGGIDDPLTTEQINELRDDPPSWLSQERETQAKVRAEEDRVAAERAKAAERARSAERAKPERPTT
ncbi:DUF5997 family protein [Cellulosimicrobium arenosum]|uniref:Uncharacterized protein n=1 Tax=Cellulosimicrobium arenosum TaxID=2708133 RepID=A0A927J1N5_9MICO|nr:DUF5997 family protein [Cellulosimicrobium arenosum]MBD8080258.1 hypothetical protein [Cellulosimicrobium arenosum]